MEPVSEILKHGTNEGNLFTPIHADGSSQGTKPQLSGFLSRSSAERTSSSMTEKEQGKLGLTTVHQPDTALNTLAIDLVFIHGLGGNSHKTWSYSSNPDHFWPKSWLGTDPDLAHVTRIHVFGYRASWKTRQDSPLDIHLIAQTLLSDLKNDPGIRRDSTRVIFVCHSMGGCVAKKAYILARQDASCKDLAARVHSIFFLGTPHRGSDLAPVLNNIVTLALGKKPFIKDLMPRSSALTDMNDTFRHYALDLRLWSFYETLPVPIGLTNKIIVEKASSTLDYPNEEISAMDADHRHLTKFKSRDDSNYRLLRNALHTAIDMAMPSVGEEKRRSREWAPHVESSSEGLTENLSKLMIFLGANENFEDDLIDLQVLKEHGSCEWFTNKACFTAWEERTGPHFLWLKGRPAAGKSIICSHVVDKLSVSTSFCSYFFFKQGNSTLANCFCSLAYQMAVKDEAVRVSLVRLMHREPIWDKTNEISVWRTLFVGIILKCPSIFQHIWVLDALDECANFSALFSKRLLAGVPKELRLFATSRDLEEIARGLGSMGSQVHVHSLSEDDTIGDMRLFISTKLAELDILESFEDRREMCTKILNKSQASFLWVRLVLQEFESAWTDEAMDAVLEDVPADLHDMYERILVSIESDLRKKNLAKAILAWVVLAPQPLSIDELRCAIILDAKQTLQNPAKSIPNICGQLVFVDQNRKVQIIHETARQFLLQAVSDFELCVSENHDHTRIASLLLQYLSDNIMKSRQTKLIGSFKSSSGAVSGLEPSLNTGLLHYAVRFFPHHVYHSNPESDSLAENLYKFLNSRSILHWIESHATWRDLGGITQAVMHMRGYLGRRTNFLCETDLQFSVIQSWLVDLIRITAKFRAQLLICPSSIHCLVPPLCPPNSIISQRFTKETNLSSLVAKNLPKEAWDDCLSRIDFTDRLARVTHGQHLFAVGFTSGRIILYSSDSLQSIREMSHPDFIHMLQFGVDEEFLVCCSIKELKVWNTHSGLLLLSSRLQSRPIAITFTDPDHLLLVSQTKGLFKWNVRTGECEMKSWPDFSFSSEDMPDIPQQYPSSAAFSRGGNGQRLLLAVAYRSYPVQLWDPVQLQPLGQCGKVRINGVNDIVFNPNSEITALIVSYSHGNLSVFNYMTMELAHSKPDVFATHLSCSLDGRKLLTGNHRGIIQVFEFDLGEDGDISVYPIYRIQSTEQSIIGLTFNFDSLRFLDMSRRQCRVWSPATLLRKDHKLEVMCESGPISQGVINRPDISNNSRIVTPPVMFGDRRFLVAGKADGCVAIFAAADGAELAELYHHRKGGDVITLTTADSARLVISACSGAHILVMAMAKTCSQTIRDNQALLAEPVLDQRFQEAVTGLVVNETGDRLFVCGWAGGELWELPSGKRLGAHQFTTISKVFTQGYPLASAFQHPSDPAVFVLVSGNIARVFGWVDFAERTSSSGIILNRFQTPSAETSSFFINNDLVIEYCSPLGSRPGILVKWPVAAFDPSSTLAGQPCRDPHLESLSSMMLSVIGIMDQTRLIFLDKNYWVCSTDLVSLAPSRHQTATSLVASLSKKTVNMSRFNEPKNHNSYPRKTCRHFFALNEWRDRDKNFPCTLLPPPGPPSMERVRQMNFVFVAEDRLIIVEGGMEYSEEVAIGKNRNMESRNDVAYVMSKNGASLVDNGRFPKEWAVVSGSMHHPASHW